MTASGASMVGLLHLQQLERQKAGLDSEAHMFICHQSPGSGSQLPCGSFARRLCHEAWSLWKPDSLFSSVLHASVPSICDQISRLS